MIPLSMQPREDVERFLKEVPPQRRVFSIKHDGYRCMSRLNEGVWEHWSRNKKMYPNFGCFDDELKILHELLIDYYDGYPPSLDTFYDGEVVDIVKGFKGLQEQARRKKDIDTSNFRFRIFDINLGNDLGFECRMQVLEYLFSQYDFKLLELVPYEWADKVEDFDALLQEYLDKGFEGLVLKDSDSEYIAGKTFLWCKLIPEHTLDLPVVGIEEGKGKLAGRVGKFICQLDENRTVKVGGGEASHEELLEFFHNPPRLIEVTFKERTHTGSLRHPRYKRVRDDK